MRHAGNVKNEANEPLCGEPNETLSLMIDFYVYLHLKPNGDPFYVGKGYGYRSNKFGNRSQHHKNVVAKCGGQKHIEICVFPTSTEQEAFEKETQWIKTLRNAGFALVNKTNGGDGIQGFHHSEETKQKMSNAAKGRKHSAETIAKVKANNKASTTEVRAKMSAAKKGRTLTQEHRTKIGLAQKGIPGKPHTEETKRKLSEANKGKSPSAETRAKISMSLIGHAGYWTGKKRKNQSSVAMNHNVI